MASFMKDMAAAEAPQSVAAHTPGPWRAHRYDALGIVTANQRDTIAKANTLADAQLIIAAPNLLDALQDILFLSPLPGENSSDAFERVASRFSKEKGMLAPGKDSRTTHPSREERRACYDEWIDEFYNRARAAIAKATGKTAP